MRVAKKYTLVLLLKPKSKQVLLAWIDYGKDGFKWNGVGGHVEVGETVEGCALREVEEEIQVKVEPKDLKKVGLLHYGDKTENHVFIVEKWSGEPTETLGVKPKWFKYDELNYDLMWADDPYWMPYILEGRTLEAWFEFNIDPETKNLKVVNHKIKEL